MFRMNQVPRFAIVFAVTAFMIMGSQVVSAQPYEVDQRNDATPPSGGFVFPGFGQTGQQFVPAFSSLDIVELYLNSQSPGTIGIAFVQIREGTITGPILGVSETFEVAPVATPLTLSRFEFPTTVTMTPGSMHVIEVVAASGNMGVFLTGFNNNSYPDGAAIHHGELHPNEDLWFREGISSSVPVEELTWGGVKALYR